MRLDLVIAFVAVCAVGLPLGPSPRRTVSARERRAAELTPLAVRLRPPRWASHRVARRRRAALPLALELLARELRSGITVLHAFQNVAAAADPVLEIDAMVERAAQGAGLLASIDWWAARFDPDDAAVIGGVFHLGTETGAAVARALDRAAAGIRARAELADEVQALTAQSRASALLVGLAPVGFGALLAIAEPTAVAFLFGSGLGIACLVLGLVLDGLGFWWMHHLVRGVAP